jgi:hypothetical protein
LRILINLRAKFYSVPGRSLVVYFIALCNMVINLIRKQAVSFLADFLRVFIPLILLWWQKFKILLKRD